MRNPEFNGGGIAADAGLRDKVHIRKTIKTNAETNRQNAFVHEMKQGTR
ncbi:MAG: hypothetical protein IID45_00805 [Planctomycetes bacterium]|nr:hypothetical protein [Planctomycetota bacterium]